MKPQTARALLTRRRRPKSLARLCHEGGLVGGLSMSLRATPDEVIGPLCHAIGGAARRLKVVDVRVGTPPILLIEWGELSEKWEVEDLAGLVHNLNDLFRSSDTKVVAVLGECEDMLQVWCVAREDLGALLEGRWLDEATNARTLWALHKGAGAGGS